MNAEMQHTNATAIMHPAVMYMVAMTVVVMVVILAMDLAAEVRIKLVFEM